MKNIVIVGAGPIGLYLAIRLAKLNSATQITLVDPKLGEYSRPGVIAKNALQNIEQGLGQDVYVPEGTVSHAIFIQDLEFALLKIAQQYNINFVQAKFDSFEKNTIQVKKKDGETSKIPCDFAIDCTGQKRELVRAAEFTIERIDDNPIKTHFVAYITMTPEQAKLIKFLDHIEPLVYVRAFEIMRSKFGWDKFCEPTIEMGRWVKGDKVHFYFYFEIPEHLEKNEQVYKEWLQTLLQLKTGHANISFETGSGLKFTPFTVDPHQVKEGICPGNAHHPPIKPCGDAEIEPYYRLGIGVESGVKRSNAFLDAMSFNDKRELVFIEKKYEHDAEPILKWHRTLLHDAYDSRREQLNYSSLIEMEKHFMAALSLLPPNESEANTLQNELKLLRGQLAEAMYQKGMSNYERVCEGGNYIKHDDYFHISHPVVLQQCREQLITAYQKTLGNASALTEKIERALLNLAQALKSIAELQFKHNEYSSSIESYKLALHLYLDHFPHTHQLEIIKLYSNLCVLENKQQKYELTLEYANRALSMFQGQSHPSDIEKMIIKIKFHQCTALLSLLSKNQDHPQKTEWIVQSGKLMGELNGLPKGSIPAAELKNLNEMFDTITPISVRNTFKTI